MPLYIVVSDIKSDMSCWHIVFIGVCGKFDGFGVNSFPFDEECGNSDGFGFNSAFLEVCEVCGKSDGLGFNSALREVCGKSDGLSVNSFLLTVRGKSDDFGFSSFLLMVWDKLDALDCNSFLAKIVLLFSGDSKEHHFHFPIRLCRTAADYNHKIDSYMNLNKLFDGLRFSNLKYLWNRIWCVNL
ncbi:hypothetical protein GQX74_008599 [Glossina fuscipes]|nr:hypothetical protein GQX74_008599 [Glossina fuscipes]